MPGFFISNIKSNFKLNNYFNDRCITNDISNDKYFIKRNTINKFLNDKLFYDDDQFIIITEGIILNKEKLIQKYNQKNLVETIKYLIVNGNHEFFSEFRGSFSGAIYDKKKDEWLIYTNHVGDKSIFYYNSNKKFMVGSQVNYLIDGFDMLGMNKTVNEKAVYYMLTYAFMGENITYLKEINKLEPGCYIKINSNGFSIHRYHKFINNKYDLSTLKEDEIINILDDKFISAIKLEYNKDLEYGYRHLVDLSGGLDSRMNTWISRIKGNFDGVLNISYCQSNYLDEVIAKEIANHLKNEILVKTLDDASFMYDIDEIVKMNFGLALYSGITGGKRLLDYINMNEFGVEHTGQLGDVIIGTFLQSEDENNKKELAGLYSTKLISKIDKSHLEKYDNHELYMIYLRGFNGALSTHLIRQNYTEVSSPFLDIDVIEFCLSIPHKFRINHGIYKKWITRKYPEAANFIWEKTNAKVSAGHMNLFWKKLIKRGPDKIARILGFKSFGQHLGLSMNPYDYWYNSNKNLKKFMDDYFESSINEVNIPQELKSDLRFLYTNGNTCEKTQVLTVLASINLYMVNKSA